MRAESEGGALMPRVSPDGDWIAVSYQGKIGTLSVGGGPLRVLSRGGGWDEEPAWSPDGKRIAYVSAPLRQMHVVEAADGAAIPLAKFVRGIGPFWFKTDGPRLLGRFGLATGPLRLAWLQLDTCELAPVTFGEVDRRIDINRTYSMPYTLSVDGHWIYFALHADKPGEQTGNNGAQAELFRAPVEGGAPKRLLEFPARICRTSTTLRLRGKVCRSTSRWDASTQWT